MDQNNPNPQPIVPPNDQSGMIPKVVPFGASYSSINPATGSTPTAIPIPVSSTPPPPPSSFKSGQSDWSKYNPEAATLPSDRESADVYKYLDPKGYANAPTAPTPVSVSSYRPETAHPQIKTIIRTYKGDIEDAVEYNHVSSIDIAIAEQKKHQQELAAVMAPSTGSDINSFKIII